MRIASITQQNATNLLPARSSISLLQNESCGARIKRVWTNFLECLSNFLKKLCYCCGPKEPRIGQFPVNRAIENENQLLDYLLDRRRLEFVFERRRWAGEEGDPVGAVLVNDGVPHIQFAPGLRFKAAAVLSLDERIIGLQFRELNMAELEGDFRQETARTFQREIQERAQNGILRGNEITTRIFIVNTLPNNRFKGGALSETFSFNNGGGAGHGAWPEKNREQLAEQIAAYIPGDYNAAARNQLSEFFLARQANHL